MLQDATWKFAGNEAKGQISKRVLQENKPRQIFRKTNISYLLMRTRTYLCVSGRREGSFYGNLASFFFLKHPFWDFPFCLFNNELFSKSRQEFQKRIQNPYQATNMELFGKLITWILNAPPYFLLLTLSWRRFLSYRNQSIDLHSKSTASVIYIQPDRYLLRLCFLMKMWL